MTVDNMYTQALKLVVDLCLHYRLSDPALWVPLLDALLTMKMVHVYIHMSSNTSSCFSTHTHTHTHTDWVPSECFAWTS